MGAPPPDRSSAQWRVENLQFFKQEQSLWCWAATAQMALSAEMSSPPSQCQIVGRVLKRDCCSRPDSCNQKNFTASALYQFGVTSWSTPLTNASEVQKSIARGKPVIIIRKSDGGSRHAVLVYGVYEIKDELYFQIFDPIFGHSRSQASSLLSRSEISPWIGTIYVK
jgi:hypothetical protein